MINGISSAALTWFAPFWLNPGPGVRVAPFEEYHGSKREAQRSGESTFDRLVHYTIYIIDHPSASEAGLSCSSLPS